MAECSALAQLQLGTWDICCVMHTLLLIEGSVLLAWLVIVLKCRSTGFVWEIRCFGAREEAAWSERRTETENDAALRLVTACERQKRIANHMLNDQDSHVDKVEQYLCFVAVSALLTAISIMGSRFAIVWYGRARGSANVIDRRDYRRL
jgi:hypothetical protein